VIKTVFFDLDDTLVPGLSIYRQAMMTLGLSEESRSYLDGKARVKALVPQGYAASHSRCLYFKRMLEIEGRYSHSFLLDLTESYENTVVELMKQEWQRLNRDDLMEALLAKGLRLAVITNETLRMQLKKLRGLDPQSRYFSTVAVSEEVGFGKPDLKIFQTALAQAQAQAEAALMIGDGIETDVLPAKSLGMKAFLSTEFCSSEKAAQADAVLSKLDEILTRL
jgi:putative hydrolase of the HAD superfamily